MKYDSSIALIGTILSICCQILKCRSLAISIHPSCAATVQLRSPTPPISSLSSLCCTSHKRTVYYYTFHYHNNSITNLFSHFLHQEYNTWLVKLLLLLLLLCSRPHFLTLLHISKMDLHYYTFHYHIEGLLAVI